MNVFDASALLAFLQGEKGCHIIEQLVSDGGVCSAANWSEVAQKVLSRGADWHLVRESLLSFPLAVEPVTRRDAERAASLWESGSGLSLADRCCLALRERVDGIAWTADSAWSGYAGVRLIR